MLQYGEYIKLEGTLESIEDSVKEETAEIVENEVRWRIEQLGETPDGFIFERIIKEVWLNGKSGSSHYKPGYTPYVTVGVKATKKEGEWAVGENPSAYFNAIKYCGVDGGVAPPTGRN